MRLRASGAVDTSHQQLGVRSHAAAGETEAGVGGEGAVSHVWSAEQNPDLMASPAHTGSRGRAPLGTATCNVASGDRMSESSSWDTEKQHCRGNGA